jgi:hypothetical protein
MRKLALVTTVILLGASAAAANYALADAPTKKPFDATVTQTITGICSFPLEVTSSFRGFELDFFDRTGALVRLDLHNVEQDTFVANGKTLVGEPFTFNLFVSFENGEVTAVLARGVAEKVRLPNAKLFLSAGVIDFLAQGVAFSLTTDRGRTGDIDAFCAALAP